LQVASFDAPAHGESAGHKTTMTRFVQATGAALRSLGNVQVLIGHSLGAIASVAALAQAQPALARAVQRVVLIAAPVSLSTVLERWAGGPERQLPRAVVAKIYERLHVQNGVPVSHWDIGVLGAGLDVPVLVVHDEHDPVVPLGEAHRLLRSLRNARLEQTSGLGHSRILSAAPVKESITRFIAASHD
jgi:omega-6 fatty acid desaturase (delta-12 desaturase)